MDEVVPLFMRCPMTYQGCCSVDCLRCAAIMRWDVTTADFSAEPDFQMG
jgi:hypothetical protein